MIIPLTAREAAIAKLMCLGWTNSRIAQHYGCKKVTVKVHVGRIYRKHGLVPKGWTRRGRLVDLTLLRDSQI